MCTLYTCTRIKRALRASTGPFGARPVLARLGPCAPNPCGPHWSLVGRALVGRPWALLGGALVGPPWALLGWATPSALTRPHGWSWDCPNWLRNRPRSGLGANISSIGRNLERSDEPPFRQGRDTKRYTKH